MAESTKELLLFLNEMYSCFERFEVVSQKMLLCDAGKVEECVDEREELMIKIDYADGKISLLEFEEDMRRELAAVFAGSPASRHADEEVKKAAEILAKIRTVTSRLKEYEPQINSKLQKEKNMILEKIRAANNTSGAVAAKYLAYDTGDTGVYSGKKLV